MQVGSKAPEATHQQLRPGWRKHLTALAIILGVVLLGYTHPISGEKVYYSDDTTDINYVMLRSHVRDLKDHGFTAWCPELGTGFYRAADPTFALYSPRLALYLLIDSYNAQVATILVYAFLAGLAAYILGLSVVRSWSCAVFLGVAWPLAGVMASEVGNIPYFTSAAWYPLILAAFLSIRDVKLRIPLTAICVSMVAVEGDLVGSGISLAVLGILALVSPASGNRKKDLLALFASAALVVGITAVIWIPAASVLPESRRGAGLPLEEALIFSMHPLRLVNLFSPRFFGQMYENSIWMPEITNSLRGQGLWFQTVYLGMLAPLLLVAALAKSHYQRKLVLGLMAAAALLCLLAFGRFNPLVPYIMEQTPFLKVFRYPAKLFTWSAMLLLAAAAIGLREASSLLSEVKTRRKSALITSLILAAAAISLMALAVSSADLLKEQSPNPETSAVRVLQDLVRLTVFTVVIPLLILFPASLKSFRGRPLVFLVAAITAMDLLTALPVFYLNPRSDFFQPSRMARLLKQEGKGRVYIDDQTSHYWRAGPRWALKYNWGVLEDISYTSGAYATVPDMIHELDEPRTVKKHPAQVFDLLALRFVITTIEPERKWLKRILLAGHLRELLRYTEPNLLVYESSSDHPRISVSRNYSFVPTRETALDEALKKPYDNPLTFLARESALLGGREVRPAPDPEVSLPSPRRARWNRDEIISVREPHGDKLIIETRLRKPGLLIIRDYSTEGWRAQVDGEERVIYYADGASRAIFVESGKHTVKLWFRPESLVLGAWLSLAFFSLAVLSLIFVPALTYFKKTSGRQEISSAS
ncbi:MAG: hypothetical protein R6V10_02440 [bacterium]